MSQVVHVRRKSVLVGSLAAVSGLLLAMTHAVPAAAATLSAGFESPDYSVASLAGQDGWVNNSSGTDHQVVVPSGSEPAAPEGSRIARLTRASGSARAAHELSGAGTLTEPFAVDVLLAYDDVSADGAFAGVYINDTSNLGGSGSNSDGVVFGYVDGADVVGGTAGDVHVAYRDGDDYHSLGLAAANTFHRFVVDVDPASASYDILVEDLSGTPVGSVQGAASRGGEDRFSVLQLAVGSGSQATLFADQVNADLSLPPTYSAGFESPDYSVASLAGQDGWVNNSSGTDHQVVVPSGSEPAAPEGSRIARLTRASGSARAAHELSGQGALTEPFAVDVLLAYDDVSADGAFAGVYINDTSNLGGSGSNSDGVVFGYVDGANVVGGTAGDVHVAYRDGDDYHSLGLAADNAFHRFVVDVDPASASYDILVEDLSGTPVGSVQDAASRGGEDTFSVLQLGVGSGSQATLFADQVTVFAGPAAGEGRRYLAVDESLHADLQDLEFVMGQFDNQQEIFELDDQWELDNDLTSGYLGSVVEDHNGDYRLYYEVRSPDGFATAVATSTDGVTWTKPALNIAPGLIDDPDSNLISVASHPGMGDGKWYENGVVLYEPNAPTSERYKLIWHHGSDFYVATSSDGLNFVTEPNSVFNHKADTGHSFFYDDQRDEYMIYGRKRGDWPSGDTDRRGIPLHSSTDWDDSPWDTVGQVVADPEDFWDYGQPIRPDLYTPNMQQYHGQYIGLPAAYFRDDNRVPVGRPNRTTGPIYPVFMHSDDGENWTLPDLDHPILNLTPHERVSVNPDATSTDPEVGQVYPNSNLLEVGDELLVYYHNVEATHYEAHPDMDGRTFHVASLRTDGFGSLQADDVQPGEWLTAEVAVPAGATALHVNADVTGSLEVEVQDPMTGNPVSGLSLANSQAFSGDDTDAAMAWTSAGIGDVAGQTVQLRFVIDDGEIFSFWFDADE